MKNELEKYPPFIVISVKGLLSNDAQSCLKKSFERHAYPYKALVLEECNDTKIEIHSIYKVETKKYEQILDEFKSINELQLEIKRLKKELKRKPKFVLFGKVL